MADISDQENVAELSANDEIQQECLCCSKGQINRQLLPSKFFYFFFFGGNGSLMPYLVLFFKQLDLTPSQVGIVSGLKPFISFLCSPLWGYLADKTRRTRIIYIVSLLAYISGYFAYSMAPSGNLCKNRKNGSSTSHHPFLLNHHKRSVLHDNPNKYTLYVPVQDIKKTKKKIIPKRGNRCVNSSAHAYMTMLYSDLTPGIMGENLFHMPASVGFFGGSDELYLNDFVTGEPGQDDVELDTKDTQSEKTWHGTVHHPNSPWTICAAAKANSNDNLNLDQSSNQDHKERRQKIFYYLLVVTVVATLFSCPLITIVDTATIRKLKETCSTHKYGKQRMWGSFGWGIVAFTVGAIISAIPLCPGINNEVNYYPAFYTFIVFLVFALIAGFKLQFEDGSTTSDVHQRISRSEKIQEGLKLLKDPLYLSFTVTSFFIGVTMSIIKTFLFWYLKDIGGNQLLFSIIAAVNCISEVTVYFFASTLINRLTHFGVLYVALICYAIRLFYYGMLTSPWYVLAVEPLSGITTAAAWAAMTSYVGMNASPESVTTMQGILHGTHWGLGHGIGEVIGGFMVSNFGAAATFNIFGAVTLFHLLIFWLINNYANKRVNYKDIGSQIGEEDEVKEEMEKEVKEQ